MLQKYLLSFFLLAITFVLSPYAYARTSYDNQTMNIEIDEKDAETISIFPRTFYVVSFFNNPNISESDFTMRLSAFGEVTGCAHMSGDSLEIKRVNDTIRLKVTDPEIELDNEKPRYSNYDCEIKNNKAYIDVPLSRDELIKNKIKKFQLKSEKYGNFIESQVNISKEKIEFTANASKTSSSMITFWFFPKNSLVLSAPKAKIGQDIQDLIREFGISRGLIPMDKALKGYEMPHNMKNSMFFTNPSGHIIKQINNMGENIEIGTITPTRTVYTSEGSIQEPYSLSITASFPKQSR